MSISSVYLNAIQKFEGFTQKAQWDYAQYTNGYGTRAQSANETITKAEAERRFKVEIDEASSLVNRFAPDLDEGTKSALTSLTFNAGTAWMKSGLGQAIKAGDLDQARNIFVQYNKAGGEVLPGLVARREAEVAWIGNALDQTKAIPSASESSPVGGTEAISRAATSLASVSANPEFGGPRPAGQNADARFAMSSRAFVSEASTQLRAQMTLDVLDFLARADASVVADPEKDEELQA